MRLIDADALNDSMYHEAFETDSELQKWDSGCWIRYKMFEKHLDMAPTVDAVPVVRGEWVVDECDTTDDVPSYSWIDFHCSECNTDYGLEEGQYGWYCCEKIPYKYCPNCGCDMRGERDGEK